MSSAQRNTFVTETITEPVPILVFGDESSFKKTLLEELQHTYSDLLILSDAAIGRRTIELAYKAIWVMSGEEDWEGAVAFAKYTKTPLIAVMFGAKSADLKKTVLKEYSETVFVLLDRFPDINEERGVAQSIIREAMPERRSGVEKHIPLPKKEVKGEHVSEVRDIAPPEPPKKETPPRLEERAPEKRKVDTLAPHLLKFHHASVEAAPPRFIHPSEDWGEKRVEIRPYDAPLKKTGLFSHLPQENEVSHLGHTRTEHLRPVSGGEEDLLQRIFSGGSREMHGKKPPKEAASVRIPGEKRRISVKHVKKPLLVVLILLMIVILPLLTYVTAHAAFVRSAKTVYTSLATDGNMGDPAEGEEGLRVKDLESFDRNTALFSTVVRGLTTITNPLGLSSIIEPQIHAVELAKHGGEAVHTLQQFYTVLERAYGAVMQSEDDPLELFQLAATRVEQASKDLSLFSAELSTVPDNVPLLANVKAADVEKEIGMVRRDLVKTQHLLSVLPKLFGEKQRRTYLVLIQNPLELRASGGFLESYAFFTFDRGRLLDIQVHDVSEADGLLKGKVDPPQDLRGQLGESQWYLRDSNWSTSFPQVARQTEWFVQKEVGRQVDGTIALNANVLQDLLRVTGPVAVGSQQEKITADNLMERLFTKSESLFQADQSKKALLSSVAEAIFARLQELRDEEARGVGGVLFHALETGDMMMSVRQPEEESELAMVGVTGTVLTPPCPPAFAESSCVVDTIYQVDSNVGVNRANYSIQRFVEHNVTLSQTAAVHAYTVHYTNTALSSAWPAGSYKNYIRLVVPDFAQVNSIIIDKTPLSPSLIAQEIKGGKREVGFAIEVPVGKTVDVQVNYVSTMVQPKQFSYALFTQRQAGTGEDPISFSLNIQKPLAVTKIAPEGAVSGSIVQFDTTLDRHQYLAVEVR